MKIFKMPLQDQLFYYIHVLITQLVLIQLLINGKEFTKLLNKTAFTHSLILLIKVSFQETLTKMEKDLDISSTKDLKWSLLNHLQRLWVFMEKELVHFISSVLIMELLLEFSLNSNL